MVSVLFINIILGFFQCHKCFFNATSFQCWDFQIYTMLHSLFPELHSPMSISLHRFYTKFLKGNSWWMFTEMFTIFPSSGSGASFLSNSQLKFSAQILVNLTHYSHRTQIVWAPSRHLAPIQILTKDCKIPAISHATLLFPNLIFCHWAYLSLQNLTGITFLLKGVSKYIQTSESLYFLFLSEVILWASPIVLCGLWSNSIFHKRLLL